MLWKASSRGTCSIEKSICLALLARLITSKRLESLQRSCLLRMAIAVISTELIGNDCMAEICALDRRSVDGSCERWLGDRGGSSLPKMAAGFMAAGAGDGGVTPDIRGSDP